MTGITSAGYANVSDLPTDSLGQVAKKAILTGALGGAAVAASGGDDAAVRDAFLKSGGMVVVQSGQSYVTKKYVDPTVAKADSYCMSAVGTKCSIALPKLQHDAEGKVLLDEKGNPKIDASAILPGRQQIGEWKSTFDQAANDAMRKVPGANAIFVSEGQWAISWDKGAFTSKTSKIPAVVVTYAGTDSPLGEKLREVAALAQPEDASGSSLLQLSNKTKQTYCLSSEEIWVALHDIGNQALFFDRVLPASRTGSVSVGEIIRANRNVSVTSGPPNWAPQPSILPQGTVVFVTETRQGTDTQGRSQDLARVEVVETNDANAGKGVDSRRGCDPIQITLWRQNDSVMSLASQGNSVEFDYEEPTTDIQKTGVTAGTLKFRGEKDGSIFKGEAYVYTKHCQNGFGYKVTGRESADKKVITLRGRPPRVNYDKCKAINYMGVSGAFLKFTRAYDLEIAERPTAQRSVRKNSIH